MRKLLLSLVLALAGTLAVNAANKYGQSRHTLRARDGTAEFRNIDDAIEVCRAFMEYHKVIFVKKGTYKEKLIVPSWLTNIEICGEDRDNTIITYDDHANVFIPGTDRKMGTFRTYTVRVDGNDITFRNITIETTQHDSARQWRSTLRRPPHVCELPHPRQPRHGIYRRH